MQVILPGATSPFLYFDSFLPTASELRFFPGVLVRALDGLQETGEAEDFLRKTRKAFRELV